MATECKFISQDDFLSMSDEQFAEVMQYVNEQEADVTFIDRALIMQFKNLPDHKIQKIGDYVDELMRMFYVSLNNYYYECNSQNATADE